MPRNTVSFKLWGMITSKRQPGAILFTKRKIEGKINFTSLNYTFVIKTDATGVAKNLPPERETMEQGWFKITEVFGIQIY